MRVGVMYYHRTNRDQIGTRNTAVPSSAYTPGPRAQRSRADRSGPSRRRRSTTCCRRSTACRTTSSTTTRTSTPTYNGVEFTAQKRFSNRWQMVAGFTPARTRAGSTRQHRRSVGQSADGISTIPNITAYAEAASSATIRSYAFRLSGSYRAPWDIQVAGSLISNTGYPYMSTYSVTRALAATGGVALTRSTQTVFLERSRRRALPERDADRPAAVARRSISRATVASSRRSTSSTSATPRPSRPSRPPSPLPV